MNKLLLLISIITLSFTASAQIDIADARGMSIGSTVTIQGVVTNGPELSIIRYVQDATGAIAAYPGTGSVANFPDNVNRGDLVEITGGLKSFNGLLEIDPITEYNVISSGNPMPDPLVVTPDGINETNESKLLQINGASFVDGGQQFGVGNYSFNADGESGEIYVRADHPLIGEDIPLASINLTGISSEFNTQYQLLPRDINDLVIADNFYYTALPKEANITNEGFDVSWTTNVAGSTVLEYGTTTDLGEEVSVAGMTSNHSVTLTGLEPGTIYYVKARSDNGSSVIESTMRTFATASNSSGTIRVYFNHGVDGSFSNGSYPIDVTPAAVEAALINRIQNAQSTIDVAAYNNNRPTIVAALSEAHDNGVQVRYITDDGTLNSALSDPSPEFSVIYGNQGSPLMHNKFMVFDADSEQDSWVFMGSMNLTTQNIAEDYNNVLFIQDQSLARTYELEFEEMWGGEGPTPLFGAIKFGEDKLDNTPHLFNINGTMVESYFSPSDNTTNKIIDAIESADSDLEFAILSFTKNEIGTAVRDAHNGPANVRGIMESIGDQGNEFDWLTSQGVNLIHHDLTHQIHHKYAIIDATNPASDPMVVTGSHNWSAGAEDRNDENTLIVHSARVANIFLQEFEARWCEVNGGNNCFTSINNIEIEGFEVTLSPNPASNLAVANMEITNASDLTIALMDMNGRIIQSSFLNNVQGMVSEEIIVSGLPAGLYLVMFQVGDQVTSKKLSVVK